MAINHGKEQELAFSLDVSGSEIDPDIAEKEPSTLVGIGETSETQMKILMNIYVHPILAVVRELIQNACDACLRMGKSITNVTVTLPCAENGYMLTVSDKGPGMFPKQLEENFLAFGNSSKNAGEDAKASSGGFGIGIKVLLAVFAFFILSTTASDKMQRTYTVRRGVKTLKGKMIAIPSGDAFEVEESGTSISCPIPEGELDLVHRTVSWLKDVQELTLGESFQVTNPEFLRSVLPKRLGKPLYLEEADPELKGWVVHLMESDSLQYNRKSLKRGSLLVLADVENKAGGLPFDISPLALLENEDPGYCPFSGGAIIVAPLLALTPAPSRENTIFDENQERLQRKATAAARTLAFAQVKELSDTPTLKSRYELNRLLGGGGSRENFLHCYANRTYGKYAEEFKKATGLNGWNSRVEITAPSDWKTAEVETRWWDTSKGVSRAMPPAYAGGKLELTSTGRHGTNVAATIDVSTFNGAPRSKFCFLVNDTRGKSDGAQRIRAYMTKMYGTKGRHNCLDRYMQISADTGVKALAAANSLNAQFGGEVPMILASSLPEQPRVVRGARVIRAPEKLQSTRVLLGGGMASSFEEDGAELDSYAPGSAGVRVFMAKTKDGVDGFIPGISVRSLIDSYSRHYKSSHNSMGPLLTAVGVDRIYLLTRKQKEILEAELEASRTEGLFDLEASDFEDEGEFNKTQALKSWISFEELVQKALISPIVQPVLEDPVKNPVGIDEAYTFFAGMTKRYKTDATDSYVLNEKGDRIEEIVPEKRGFLGILASKPRFELVGTKLETALSKYIDVVNGEIHALHDATPGLRERAELASSLIWAGSVLEFKETDSDERKQIKADIEELKNKAKVLNYKEVYRNFIKEFPLFSALDWRAMRNGVSREITEESTRLAEDGFDQLILAAARLYR